MKKKISIHDIARHCNVSSTTVSFVLNNKAGENKIRKEVVDKILNYVKEVNYTPNQVAKSLRTGKTRIIGMLVEEFQILFLLPLQTVLNRERTSLDIKYSLQAPITIPAKRKI